ncbi:ABC transporter ATP-binding protein [candidate division TA06 bacterium]|uniref:ABC transporter ATP-binding protein n=1 Tax=candidate division TA06 bacterium TaxID=2250710 RepID=A0A660SKY1_UNCT6|nr:MAG: ABC transporter ATP-binding protein [candidate division TA06 bacterium]
MPNIIEVNNLHKSYGKLKAVDGISFDVKRGEIFGIVGPNGAGKTTTIECIEGLRNFDRGEISVLNLNLIKDRIDLRNRVGMQLQESSLPARLKVWEIIDLYASFYNKSINQKGLLEKFGLVEKKNNYFSKLSGGQKQRLFIILALLNDPDVIFLDEITTGLDPQARRAMWEIMLGIKNSGKTILLTTHFMEEAEYLCDRVAIIDNGHIIALDTTENLIKNLNGYVQISFLVKEDFDIKILESLNGITNTKITDNKVIIHGDGKNILLDVVNRLSESKIDFTNLNMKQPNLEDVFLELTGHEMRD